MPEMRVNLLSCLLVGLVIVALVPHTISAEASSVHIKSIIAPKTIAAGQSLSVTVVVTYNVGLVGQEALFGTRLVIAILDQYPNGKLLPATGLADRCALKGLSICIVNYPPFSGDFNSSFTLTATNQTGKWYLWVSAMVETQPSPNSTEWAILAQDYTSFAIDVTPTSVSETTSSELSFATSSATSTLLTSSTSTSSSPTTSSTEQTVSSAILLHTHFSTAQTSSPVPPASYIEPIALTGTILAAIALAAVLISQRRSWKPAAKERTSKGVHLCLNCGAELPPESKFCNQCGSSQT
jgi:ribosomal protein L40E